MYDTAGVTLERRSGGGDRGSCAIQLLDHHCHVCSVQAPVLLGLDSQPERRLLLSGGEKPQKNFIRTLMASPFSEFGSRGETARDG